MNHPRGSRREQAFTVTELLLGTGVASVLLVICLTGLVGLQKFQAVCLARSGLRTEIIRLFDAIELDLHLAKTVTAAASGGESIFPVILSVPQRYSAYAPTGKTSGEPARTATRIQPAFNTGTSKLNFGTNITIRYETAPNGTMAQDIKRTVIWTEAGVGRSASRVIATIPKNATIRFRSSTSTSAIPSPITASDIAIVAKVNSPLSSTRSADAVPTAMESTIYLRRKAIK